MEIKSISQKIFRAAPEKTQGNHSNPFGVNFKGSIIKMDAIKNADVFESGSKLELISKVSDKVNKLRDAMNIGSINSYLSSRLVDPVVNLGRRIKSSAKTAWNNLNETVLNLGIGRGEDNKLQFAFAINNHSVGHYKKINDMHALKNHFSAIVDTHMAERAAA